MEKITFGSRLKHAWNAFLNRDPTNMHSNLGVGSSIRPDRVRLSRGNERSIVTSLYNRIAMDTAAINIKHIRLDDNGRYVEDILSGLNECLTIEANVDQTGRALVQDIVMSMLDEGCVAVVPIDTTTNPRLVNSYDINSLRTGKIIDWYPNDVKINIYNEKQGKREDIILPKKMVAIIENPLFAILNEPNSTLQRLIRKLNLLDYVDEQSGSGKLDLIIQLPYTIKNELRQAQADKRRDDIEEQLYNKKYGVAYIDSTEKIVQLNRPIDNNLMKQVEYLTNMLYSQLGITQAILDGTADEKTMLNYYNRTIEPIISAIVDEMKRKFLTKTARTQGQSISFFKNAFSLVPMSELATMADSYTRNEIMTSNEVRQLMGMKPSSDPTADELRNKNLSKSNADIEADSDHYEDE